MSKQKKWGAVFRAAFPITVPVLTGFLILGMAYGILMQSKGYGVLWSALMSSLAFCGSMQFVAVTLLTATFDPMQAFLLSLTVNARHLFYGLSMLKKYSGTGKLKFFLIYLMCDETYSINSSTEVPDGIDAPRFYFAVSVMDYAYWIAGTVIGALIGAAIGLDVKGLDFVLTALFLVLFLEQWKKKENRVFCITGLTVTAICLIVFGADGFVIPAMLGIFAVLLILGFTGRRKAI